MLRSALIAVSLAVGAGLVAGRAAHALKIAPPPPSPRPPQVDVGAELGAAIRARSAARVTKLLADPIRNYGVWFTDAACAKQFGAPGLVAGPEIAAFARCLAQLKLVATTRQPGSQGSAILTHAPGVEIELGTSGGRVQWVGFLAQTAADRGRPTLTAQAFEALRRAGKPNLDESVSSRLEPVLERAKVDAVSAWMKICVDEEGAVDQVTAVQTDAPRGQGDKVSTAFEVAIQRNWRFRPFMVRGKPMAVCSMALLTYPTSRAPLVETLPPARQPGFRIAKEPEPSGLSDNAVEGEGEDEDEDIAAPSLAPPPPPPPPRKKRP